MTESPRPARLCDQCALTLDSHEDALDSEAECTGLGNLRLDFLPPTMRLPASCSGYYIMAFLMPTAPEEGLGKPVMQVGWVAVVCLPRGLSLRTGDLVTLGPLVGGEEASWAGVRETDREIMREEKMR